MRWFHQLLKSRYFSHKCLKIKILPTKLLKDEAAPLIFFKLINDSILQATYKALKVLIRLIRFS